jgi:hypothetical protein
VTALRVFHIAAPVSSFALIALAGVVHGEKAALAALLGLVGTAAYLYATWLVVKLAGQAVSKKAPSPLQTSIAFSALVLKLPLIYLGWLAAKGLGPFGPTWFLLGLGLVYCLTVWRAVLSVR